MWLNRVQFGRIGLEVKEEHICRRQGRDGQLCCLAAMHRVVVPHDHAGPDTLVVRREGVKRRGQPSALVRYDGEEGRAIDAGYSIIMNQAWRRPQWCERANHVQQ